ncbi:MAG: type I 3-dehydroquinate dehydratase [Candidatus Thalassarchaeaceae archaeon]|nr:type I 3-dehydroquinate dehydratase [Candidatus Thalassarchaeaceae archaeon]
MQKPLVCATLRGRTVEEMCNDAPKAVELGADIVEARLDLLWTTEEKPASTEKTENGEKKTMEIIVNQLELDAIDIEDSINTISSSIAVPLMMTCRPQRQGGHFPGSEEDRLSVLEAAIASKPSWIDLEVDIESSKREDLVELAGKGTRVIASLHSLDAVPSSSEITQDVMDAQSLGDSVKACYSTKDRKDALRIFESALQLKSSDVSYSLMGLGPGGDWSRIHAPALGQELVFATTESGWHLAQKGKINVSDLRTAWEVLEYS